jgi:peptidoglycan-associated lipoprotein
MNIKAVSLLMVAAGVLTLSACSHKRAGSSADVVDGAGGAYSSGVGEQGGYGSNGQGGSGMRHSTTEAPHEQTYYFDYDSNRIHEDDAASVSAQANYLASNRKAKVSLAGHTDERGSREYNIGLGERRAKSVAEKMKVEGAQAQQVRMVSYGAEKPAATGNDESAYAQNRRVELTYEDEGK